MKKIALTAVAVAAMVIKRLTGIGASILTSYLI
jgi:hypothetical protein